MPRRCLAGAALLTVLGVVGASQLQLQHNPLKWLPETHPARISTEGVDHQLGGSISVEVLVDTKTGNGVQDPRLLTRIEELKRRILSYDENFEVGKIVAVNDIIKETHQALHGNDPDYYALPDDRPLLAQEFFLLEAGGADDLFDLVDNNYQQARISIRVPFVDILLYKPFMEVIEQQFGEALEGYGKVSTTGLIPILGRTLDGVMTTTIRSYLIAIPVLTIMMILLLGHLRLGLLSMIPNLLPLVMGLGLMKLLGIPLDMFTMLIGAIVLGLAIDDTVHFMHNFRKFHGLGLSAQEAVARTLHTSGRALLATTIILSLSFYAFTFSELNSLDGFGIITAACMIFALLADFLVAPAMMVLIYRQGNSGEY